METRRQHISSGTKWEAAVGYSRAVRVGSIIHVSGTTATDAGGNIVGVGDPYVQTMQAIMNIESALLQPESCLEEVVRTRIYVKNIGDWEKIGAAHAKFFERTRPATSMVEVNRFIDTDILVEIEAEAISFSR